MVDGVEDTDDRIVVTRNGRPAAVMISSDELASLEDTFGLLSDPVSVRELADARETHARGYYVTGDELRARLTTGDGPGSRVRAARHRPLSGAPRPPTSSSC